MRCLLPVLMLAAACKNDGAAATHERTPDTSPGRKLAGTYPEDWKCDTVATVDALAPVLGGPVHQMDSALVPPRGVPHPCNYEVQTNGVEYWTFDIDCRDGMKQRADALFAQYTNDSAAQVQAYNRMADAGIKPTDAGTIIHAPENAAEVAVGAKALDHHGQGLIFIDDDAPCYVRVVGPDASRRLELGKLLAKNLTFVNAPMTPRPMP